MAKTIAICNQKGGVSKTTTAVNLSSFLSIENKKTLLIDIDPQANATSGIGIEKRSIKNNIYDVLHEHIDIPKATMRTSLRNLFVVPSGINLTGAEIELVNVMGREYRLKKALEPIMDLYEFIIIDCPPSLSLLTINALTAADSVIIPIQCEYYALEGLTQLMNTISLVRGNLNTSLEVEGVVLTMADYRTKLTAEVIEEVKKFFGDKVYDTIIPRSIKLTEAPGFGKPIALYDSDSVGAQKYHELAREVLKQKTQLLDNKEVMEVEGEADGT